jgi:hypothetical protein
VRVEAQPLPYLNDAAALEPPSFHSQRLGDRRKRTADGL